MKRILSFIVVCVMLVSCFAVMNVGAEETNTWTLSGDWSTGAVEQADGWDIAVQGNWSMKSFTDLSDITTAISNPDVVAYGDMTTFNKAQTPYPYVGSNNNESKAQGKDVTNYTATNWYVNHSQRWGGIMFSSYGGATAIAFCADGEQKGALIFTAPSAGTYSYTETVTGLLFALTDNTPVTWEVTVRKNGAVLDTFVPTADNASKTIAGTVELAEGDLLMFCFEQTSHLTLTSANAGANDPKCIGIDNVVITKTAASGGDSGAQGGTTTNPDTSDNLVLAVSALALAAAGVVIASKKRR